MILRFGSANRASQGRGNPEKSSCSHLDIQNSKPQCPMSHANFVSIQYDQKKQNVGSKWEDQYGEDQKLIEAHTVVFFPVVESKD